MKKNLLLLSYILLSGCLAMAQSKKPSYPEPEFSKEVYAYNKEGDVLTRLEKETGSSKTKTKLGGIGGMENGYEIEGEKAHVRFPGMNNLSFIYTSSYGASKPGSGEAPKGTEMAPADSMSMGDASGAPDMSGMSNMMENINDPSQMISLFKLTQKGGSRKVIIFASQGMTVFSKKDKGSLKYTLSFKKIRDGYFEIVVDKPLPSGEYAFVNNGGMNSMQGGQALLYAFAID